MPWRRIPLVLTGLLLAACGGLGGEPEIAVTVVPRQAASAPVAADFVWQPDIVNGGQIFAERCVECHGASGDGLGELVLAGSVGRPIDMTNRVLVAPQSPLEWYEIITKGVIANLMPPWENALSERERWDVALYAYTLAYDDELLALGERLWRRKCADCARPAAIPPLLSDVEFGSQLDRELFDSALTDAEAEAAAAYARMQSLAGDGEYEEGGGSLPAGAYKGRLEHGTAGSAVPPDTVVQLQYGNGDIGYRVTETTIDDDRSFHFEDIPLSADFDYVVGAVYGERLFSQRVAAGEMTGNDSAPTITLYDATDDPFVISVARIDLFIESVTLEDLGAGLYISQIISYRNSSDRIYTSGRGFDDGREAALLIQFPTGARLLSGDARGRYVVIEDLERLPDSVIDTLPVMPGEGHNVILEYWLTYEDGADFEQAFNNLLEAEVTVTLSDDLQAVSDVLRQKDGEGAGEGYRVYAADLRMERNPQLSFGISGDLFATSSDDGMVVTSETLPALLIGVVALAAALLAGIGVMKRRKDNPAGEIELLAQELARLEDDHDQGRINHDLYHHRRRELKAKLAQLMEMES